MELRLAYYFSPRQNLIVPNVSWGFDIHECDLLVMSPSGYLTEVEIKVSLSDLKKDGEKLHEHEDKRIKKLYFALPQYLYDKGKAYIPERAGILVVDPNHEFGVSEERPPMVQKDVRPLNIDEKYQLARLGAIRVWNLRRKIRGLKLTKEKDGQQ